MKRLKWFMIGMYVGPRLVPFIMGVYKAVVQQAPVTDRANKVAEYNELVEKLIAENNKRYDNLRLKNDTTS